MGRECQGEAPYLGSNIHDVPDSGGLREGQAVQGSSQQVPAAPDAAGRNVCALLHPPHHLQQDPTHSASDYRQAA